MRSRNVEFAVIKISIIISCLIIGGGLAQKYLLDKNTPSTLKETSIPSTTKDTATTTPIVIKITTTTPQSASPIVQSKGKVVAIGDSYTYGYPLGVDSSWVKASGVALEREFVNKGMTSQTSGSLLNRFKADVLDLKPECVIILSGTGDALQGVPLSTFQRNMQEIVRQTKEKNIEPIIGLPLLYPGQNYQKLINSYRDWLVVFAQTEGLKVINFNPDLYDANGVFKQGMSDDGRYPNKHGYDVMSQIVVTLFKSVF